MFRQTSPTLKAVFDRRELLIAAGLVAAGAGMAGCDDTPGDAFRQGEAGVFFTARQLAVIGIVSDVMIPETDTPGARAVNAAAFADGLMEGWALKDTQEAVLATLSWLHQGATQRGAAGFLDLPATDQLALVTLLDGSAFATSGESLPMDVVEGYRALKSIIYRGYYLSELGATQELQYQHVPGRFRGCVPLVEIGRTWAA